MKQFFTSQTIGVVSGTMLVLTIVWFASKANAATTEFMVVACCTSLAFGAFVTWVIRSLLGWRRARS
jgi:hypothetical protein